MGYLKKYCSLKAASLLESVIALCIISVCILISIMLYSRIYTPRTSVRAHNIKNRVDGAAVLSELGNDTIREMMEADKKWQTTEEDSNGAVKLTLTYRDSLFGTAKACYYIAP